MCCGSEGCLPVPSIKIDVSNSCNSDCTKCNCCCFPFIRIFRKTKPTEQEIQVATKVERVKRRHHKKHIDKSQRT